MPDLIPEGGDDRASMLAELRAIDRAPAPTEDAEPEAPAPKETGGGDALEPDEDTPTVEDEAQEPEASEDDAELDAEAEIEPDAEEDEEVDPETAKRFQPVQREEKRARAALAAERREFEEERQRWRDESKDRIAAVERFEKLKERARYDLAAVAKELGITEEEFEYHAERLYRLSPKGQKDPRNKQMTEQQMREREAADRIAKLEKQIQEREAREAQEREVAEQKKAADQYLDEVQKQVGKIVDPKTKKAVATPLVAKMLKADPEWGRDKLRRTAARMIKETGEVPKASAVVLELEKRERARLAKLGVDIPQAGGTTDASAPSKKGAAKTKQPGAGATVRPQPKTDGSERPAPKTPEEERAEIVRAMREGNLE
jgi:hypothetical protein